MKSKITRKNRDRQGGHQAQLNTSVGNAEITPKMKKFIKQQSVKKIRRDHAKALRGALQEYQESLYQKYIYLWDYGNESFGYKDELTHEFEAWRDGFYDTEYLEPCSDDYHYDDWGDYYYHDLMQGDEPISTDDISTLTQSKAIITQEDCGKTLGQLLREHHAKYY